MNRRNAQNALIALCLVLAACSGETATSSTTVADPSTTAVPTAPTTSEATAPDTTGRSSGRDVELVDCEEPAEEVAIVCEAYDLIQTHYVDEIDEGDLAEAARLGLELLDGSDSEELLVCAAPDEYFSTVCDVAGGAADDSTEAAEAMVAGLATFALDPNSGYFDPQALDLLQEEQEGEIEGIGALVSPEDETIPGDNKQCGVISETCRLLVVSTIAGAPAEEAGLVRDDVIIGVDGQPILDWTVDEVTSAVRGPSGTEVILTIERGDETLDISIERAAVLIPVLEDEVVGDVGYVRLYNFTGNAGPQFEESVVDMLSAGVDELVIDFRDNPGGFLTTAIEVASVFLEEGDVVITEGPGENLSYEVNGNAIVPDDMDVTVVVNKGSASASEVVSAVLQERGRATVVGENTFGKNTVQQRFSLSNGGALKLTIARWLTPGGLDFGGTGVTPDLALDVNGLDSTELVESLG
ncbi:MAG TPA: S41 family peptidase [Acidimicrobiia bacterium]|nr:S41 family peptidase [Acidimicrobiia bacterium]